MLSNVLALLVCSIGMITSVSSASPDAVPYLPVVIPLAVRSPYLGAYLQESKDKNLARQSPRFWTTKPLGWQGLLRVDGTTWNWMGNITEWKPTINASTETDSFSSTFVMTDDPPTVRLKATFLSPVTPTDLFRQSLPFSYLSLEVSSLDGEPHQVEVYTDVNGLWLADDEAELLEWVPKTEQSSWKGLSLRLKDQRMFEEENGYAEHPNDHILHGDLFYATRTLEKSGVESTISLGDDAYRTRRQFAEHGQLDDTVNTTFRSTRMREKHDQDHIIDEPVFAIAHSFGWISPRSSAAEATALVTVGHVRDPIVRLKTDGRDLKQLRPLWTSTFKDAEEMITFFLQDYEHSKKASEEYNRQLYADARRVQDEEYGHTVAVPTRQVFAAMEAAVDYSLDTKSSLVTYSPLTGQSIPTLLMLKEVSSNGNCQTVDVIAPFLPFMLYASPTMLPLLLESQYRYSAAGTWKNDPPAHDLGDHYPSFFGHDDYLSPSLPIEEAGNMLGMACAGVLREDKASVDQARQYYTYLKQYANYLVDNALFPEMQSSTDDFQGPEVNTTSLVIKGIMGIRSMAEIARVFGEKKDTEYYFNAATDMTATFLELGTSVDSTHLLGHYGNDSSWHSQYNMFFDRLFATEMFPQSVYDSESVFYMTVAQEYGAPLDSAFPERLKIDWLAWMAATSTANETRAMFIDAVAKYYRQDRNWERGDLVTAKDGWSVGFQTRPVEGGMYSLLALDVMERLRGRSWHRRVADRVLRHTSFSSIVAWTVGLLTTGAILSWLSRRNQHARGRYGLLDGQHSGLASNSGGQRGDESPLLDRSRLESWSSGMGSVQDESERLDHRYRDGPIDDGEESGSGGSAGGRRGRKSGSLSVSRPGI